MFPTPLHTYSVYINPKTRNMQEHQRAANVKCESSGSNMGPLKTMDEDLAEDSDEDHPRECGCVGNNLVKLIVPH